VKRISILLLCVSVILLAICQMGCNPFNHDWNGDSSGYQSLDNRHEVTISHQNGDPFVNLPVVEIIYDANALKYRDTVDAEEYIAVLMTPYDSADRSIHEYLNVYVAGKLEATIHDPAWDTGSDHILRYGVTIP